MDKKKHPKYTRNFDLIRKREMEFLMKRRALLDNGEDPTNKDNLFGVACSGGGIRSATINLGFQRYLNQHGLLQKADYISTVSGGGYAGSYLQATIKNSEALAKETPIEDDNKLSKVCSSTKKNSAPFHQLFTKNRIDHLISKGEYMTPGTGLTKTWNRFLLFVSYSSSLVMSWIGPVVALIAIIFFWNYIVGGFDGSQGEVTEAQQQFNTAIILFRKFILYGFIVLVFLHFVLNIIYNYSLDISLWLNKTKAAFGLLVLLGIGVFFLYGLFLKFNIQGYQFGRNEIIQLSVLAALFIAGFFANPNALSLHRYYRKRLADAFLESGGEYKNVALGELANIEGNETDFAAPYPLINTCLNLQSGQNDENIMGIKSGDYFLLSPYFCGSKLTGYVSTSNNYYYKKMTLPAAMAISAAAVNPGMGLYSNAILSAATTLFNFRLGYWALSPIRVKQELEVEGIEKNESLAPIQKRSKLNLLSYKNLKVQWKKIVWWPKYFFYELFFGINTKHRMLNISDGGHIENLAVFELLRRKCKLIIAVDGGADPNFEFADLQNLTVRARNELGLEIRFREDQIPEEVIRPQPSSGFSRTHFAVADIIQLTEKKEEKGKVGIFVYVKSSVTAPSRLKRIHPDSPFYESYKYKTYHAEFPHESTSDQFFDKAQWEAYYYLGYFMAEDTLLGRVHQKGAEPQHNIDDLYDYFNKYKHKDPNYAFSETGQDYYNFAEFKERMNNGDIA